VTLQAADKGDTTTLDRTLTEAGAAVANLAARQLEQPCNDAKVNLKGIEEVVTDKGYMSGAVLTRVKGYGLRSYIPEKRQTGKRRWQGKAEEQRATYDNRRRVRGHHGKSLLKRRGELVERSFAHCYETGGMRRCHLRGRENILKRQLTHVSAFNLSLAMRKLLGAGTPRELKNRAVRLVLRLFRLLTCRPRPGGAVELQIAPLPAATAGFRSRKATCRPLWNLWNLLLAPRAVMGAAWGRWGRPCR